MDDHDSYVFLERFGKPGGGKGILVSTNFHPTLTSQVLYVCTEEKRMKDDNPTFALEGNGTRPSHRGSGISEPNGKMFTLNTTEVHGVMYDEESTVYDSHPMDSRVTECKGVTQTLSTRFGGENDPNTILIREEKESNYIVRRITPTEAERLQGFPDGYTDIPWPRSKDGHAPDSHRYKALGNSMAVPVMRWIAERIDEALANPITEDTSEPIAWQPELF